MYVARSVYDPLHSFPKALFLILFQVFSDYVHIITRLPQLLEEQVDDAVPDASQSTEIDDLARSVPKLIGILPDVLRNNWDPRHPAALKVMTAALVAQTDKIRPLALVGFFFRFPCREEDTDQWCSHRYRPCCWMKR